MKGDYMGNDLVGKVIDKMKEFRPNKTVMKIWNQNKLCVILAVKNPAEWQMEMDPYYVYIDGKVDGVSFIDNEGVLSRVMKPRNMIYHNKSID